MKAQGIRLDLVDRNYWLNRALMNSRSSIFTVDELELCFTLRKLSQERKYEAIMLLIRVQNLQLTVAYDIARLLQSCKEQGVYLITFSQSLSLAHLVAMAPCHVRVAPPLAGPINFSFYFHHMGLDNISRKAGINVSTFQEGSRKLGSYHFSKTPLSEASLKDRKDIATQILKKAVGTINRYTGLNLDQPQVIPTAVEAVQMKLLTHANYEELLPKTHPDRKQLNWNRPTKKTSDLTLSSRFNRNTILVIEIKSSSLSLAPQGFSKILTELTKQIRETRAAAIFLLVNSAGGSLTHADRIWNLLYFLRNHIPVIVYSRIATSAAYCIASAATKFIISPFGLLGGVGATTLQVDASALLSKLGIEDTVVGAGVNATSGFTSTPESSLSEEVLTRRARIAAELFRERIKLSRALSDLQLDTVAQGQIFSSSEGLKLGLADLEGDFITSIKTIVSYASITQPSFVRVSLSTNPQSISRFVFRAIGNLVVKRA